MLLQRWLERRWYGERAPEWPLRALAWLFGKLVARRRAAFAAGKRRRYRADKPVLVVGNLTVGGVGKTPLVIALVRALQQRGLQVGVVSRGYGRSSSGVQRVESASSAAQVGDEPKLIQQSCNCPVAVAESRSEAVCELLKAHALDLVIADDGLQHYALERDVEIAVVDGARGLGNGQLLPAGPLREPIERLAECDLRVCNGEYQGRHTLNFDASIRLQPQRLRALPSNAQSGIDQPRSGADKTPTDQALNWLQGRRVHALAGIGHPERFFSSLRALGAKPIVHPYPDHHRFVAGDFDWDDDLPVVMTEKDAVKLPCPLSRQAYALEVSVELEDRFVDRLLQVIQKKGHHA